MSFTFDHVVSLGPNCLPAFQTRRAFPRLQCKATPFSSQITPASTVVAALQNGLTGLMERGDLRVGSDGIVENMRWNTRHPHEFPEGLLSFANARSRHDHLCRRLRALLSQSAEGLLFFLANTTAEDVAKIESTLRTTYPHIRFRLVCVTSTEQSAEAWGAAASGVGSCLQHGQEPMGFPIVDGRKIHPTVDTSHPLPDILISRHKRQSC